MIRNIQLKVLLITAISCLGVRQALPQNPLNVFLSEIDSGYIQTFPNALTLKSYLKGKYLFLGVEDYNKDYELEYIPNGNNSAGFGLSYKWVGFGIDFKIADPNSTETYGETEYVDFQANFYLRKGVFDLFYQKYKGFYLENTSAMILGWNDENKYLIRPDIEVVSSGANYTHVIHPEKFSYISSFSQTEVQKKSAGSFILGAAINFHRVSADSSFVPENLLYEDAFLGNDVTSLKGITTNARFGYAHTFVARQRFFFSLSLDVGVSHVYSIYRETGQNQKHGFHINPNASTKFALGYNYNKWFAGLNASGFYHSNRPAGNENVIRIDFGFVNILVARRIILKKDIGLPDFK